MENKKESVLDNKKNINYWLTCSECSKVVRSRPDRTATLVVKAGSEENLIATYKCRECRKKDRQVETKQNSDNTIIDNKLKEVEDLSKEQTISEYKNSGKKIPSKYN